MMLINAEDVIKNAEACVFTDRNDKRRFMDLIKYCADNSKEVFAADKVIDKLDRVKQRINDTVTDREYEKGYISGYVDATNRAIDAIICELKTKGGLTNGKTSACDSLQS